jgi:hypothetical protein
MLANIHDEPHPSPKRVFFFLFLQFICHLLKPRAETLDPNRVGSGGAVLVFILSQSIVLFYIFLCLPNFPFLLLIRFLPAERIGTSICLS